MARKIALTVVLSSAAVIAQATAALAGSAWK